MYKIFFQTLLVVTCLGISFSAVAVEYTARHSKQKKEAAQKLSKSQCSDKDIRAINKFNRKAKSEIKDWHERNELSNNFARGTTGLTKKEILKTAKKANKLVGKNFFSSEKYTAMKAVYKRCNRDAPMIKVSLPFWIPDNLYGALGTKITPM